MAHDSLLDSVSPAVCRGKGEKGCAVSRLAESQHWSSGGSSSAGKMSLVFFFFEERRICAKKLRRVASGGKGDKDRNGKPRRHGGVRWNTFPIF